MLEQRSPDQNSRPSAGNKVPRGYLPADRPGVARRAPPIGCRSSSTNTELAVHQSRRNAPPHRAAGAVWWAPKDRRVVAARDPGCGCFAGTVVPGNCLLGLLPLPQEIDARHPIDHVDGIVAGCVVHHDDRKRDILLVSYRLQCLAQKLLIGCESARSRSLRS